MTPAPEARRGIDDDPGHPARHCGACFYFDDASASIERGLPGLTALSSAQGASRTGDGLCHLHDRYLRASATCGAFRPKQH
jgi:hypothetical protein